MKFFSYLKITLLHLRVEMNVRITENFFMFYKNCNESTIHNLTLTRESHKITVKIVVYYHCNCFSNKSKKCEYLSKI